MDNYLLKTHGNNNLLIGDFNDQFINDIYDNINDLDYVDNEQEIINQHDYASNFKDNSNNELNKHCHQNINVDNVQDAKNNVKIHQNNVKKFRGADFQTFRRAARLINFIAFDFQQVHQGFAQVVIVVHD